MEERSLIEIEKELYLAYVAKYGGGHTVVRQFRSYLMNGPRAGDGRRLIANAANEITEAAAMAAKKAPLQVKQSAPLVPEQEPTKSIPAPLPNKSTVPMPEKTEGDPVVVGRLSDIHYDIEKGVSNTQMAAKYDKKELTECAKINGVTILPEWNEKQIIAAIKKTLPQ